MPAEAGGTNWWVLDAPVACAPAAPPFIAPDAPLFLRLYYIPPCLVRECKGGTQNDAWGAVAAAGRHARQAAGGRHVAVKGMAAFDVAGDASRHDVRTLGV